MESYSMDNLVFDQLYQTEGFESQRRYPNEALIQFLAAHYFRIRKPLRKDIRILEVGCGSGANLWMIAREGFEACGLDLSQAGLDLCRKMLEAYGTRARLDTGNLKSMPYENQYFDAIADITCMQHMDIQAHRRAYTEIRRCLKPGGRFFSWHLGSKTITFREGGGRPIDEHTIDNAPNTAVPLNNAGVTCFLPVTKAAELLTAAGFQEIKIETVTRTYAERTQTVEYLAISALNPVTP